MGAYKPLYISGIQTGLVESRENFILPNDAYPVLNNAYVWRERILRKKGGQKIGRLQRNITSYVAATTNLGSNDQTINLFSTASITETNA